MVKTESLPQQRKVSFFGSRARRREALYGLLFLSPWLLGILFFVGGPIIASFWLSFNRYDIISSPRYIGLANFREVFADDPLFWPSLWRTFYYSIIVVPLGLVGSLLLAVLLNQGLRGTTFYRTFYFLPHLTPLVAAALLWKWILQPEVGPLNYLLSLVGIPGPAWLGSKEWAIPAMIIIALWAGLGGNRMLIFLAGLQGVPEELYEAAEIDGASAWHKFRYITLAMITPTIFFNLILGIIAALKVFATAFIATEGGPAYATWFIALHIYQQAFGYFRMGYASALSWVFLVIILVFTLIQFGLSRRWVYYAGE